MNRKRQTAILFLLTAMLAISVAAQMARWSFNTIGSPVFDDSGHDINGTIIGLNPGLDNGVSGYSTDIPGSPVTDGVVSWPNTYSYRFAKGVGQIILSNNLHLLNLTSMPVRVTIEAFFKLSSTRLPMRILHLENKTNDPPQTQISPFLSPVEPAPLPAMTIQSDNTTNYVTVFANAVDPTPVAVKQWHHMAIVIDGTNFTFYLDYQLIEIENADTFTAGPFKDFDKAGLGCVPGSSANDFDGWLDEIRITQAALSPTQFLRAGKGPIPAVRTFLTTATNVQITAVTQSGLVYQVQGLTNLNTSPQLWQNIGNVFTGTAFYTTVTNNLGSNVAFRVVRYAN